MKEFADRLQTKAVVLIDSEQLAELVMDHGIGVKERATYTVKALDPDYFDDET